MKKSDQTVHFRKSMLKYASSHSISATARRYHVSRGYVYFWRDRYDGTDASLLDRSSRPRSHPAQHTPEEITMIKNSCRRCPHDGLVVRWVKLRSRGYARSISGLYRVLQRIGFIPVHLPNPKQIHKPYEAMLYPGQRVQVDVKIVPRSCIADPGLKLYQYTAIDEYSRYRYIEMFEEHSTHSSALFLDHLIKAFPFRIECVQTDHGSEFVKWKSDPTYKSNPTLFQVSLKQYGIKHKLIKPYTPRHNGKVERSHRKDNEYFYSCHRFYSVADAQKQLKCWLYQYNNFPMRPLSWQSPKQYLHNFLENRADYSNECVNGY